MSRIITLDKPMIDYVTATSFDTQELYRVSLQAVSEIDQRPKIDDGVRQLNYVGFQAETILGNVFYGEGRQKGMAHSMLRLSGEVADNTAFLTRLYSLYRMSMLKVSRLDLQITVEQPTDWRQWTLFNRLKRDGVAVGWHESNTKDGINLATVYAGQRTSGKFARYYQKLTNGNGLLLRSEYELKGAYANSYWQQLVKGQATVRQLLGLLVEQSKDAELIALLMPKVGQPGIGKVKIARPDSNTEQWLINTVIPALRRYANQHDRNEDVIAQLRQLLDESDGLQT